MSDHLAKKSKNRTILVTGGTGLVGKGIQMHLESSGQKHPGDHWVYLSTKEGDLTKFEDTKKVFEKYKPTHVIHLAAKVGGLFRNMREKIEFFKDNMAINENILECCILFDVEKCISCMSTCIFPDKITYPIDETMVHLGPPHNSNEGYAYAKRMVDVLGRMYNERYKKTKFTSVIPTNIFGPYDNYNMQDGHVIPGLIHKCYLAKRDKTDFVVWGSGKPLRQFIYSQDLGALLVWTLDHYDSEEPIILSVGEEDEISIGEVAKMIKDSMDFKGNLVFDTSKSDGQFKKNSQQQKTPFFEQNIQIYSVSTSN